MLLFPIVQYRSGCPVQNLAIEPDIKKVHFAKPSLKWLKATVITALAVALYGNSLMGLAVDCWTDPSLSQGLLIPPLVAYLAWLRRDRLTGPATPDNRGLAVIALACILLIVGRLGAELFLPRISFVVFLVGLIWSFWGVARVGVLALPLALLASMVPLPRVVYNSLSAPLQLFASKTAAVLARLLGITVHQDGNIIALANLSLGVEEACNGLGTLSVLIMAGLLLGNMECTRRRTQAVVFALTVPIAIAINVFRITLTAILADYNTEFAVGVYHSFSGWLIFTIGFVMLYGVSKGLHRLMD